MNNPLSKYELIQKETLYNRTIRQAIFMSLFAWRQII